MLRRVHRKELTVPPVTALPSDSGSGTSAGARDRVRAATRRLARAVGPRVVERLASHVSAGALRETDLLRAEVAQLRAEVARLRSDMEAELALLRAEAAAVRR